MLSLVGSIIPLVLLIFKEYFEAKARARAIDEKFELDQAMLKLIVDTAVVKWATRNSSDSQGAGKAWDSADDNKKGPDVDSQGPI